MILSFLPSHPIPNTRSDADLLLLSVPPLLKFLVDQDEESGDLGLDLNLSSPELGAAENDFHRKIADLCKKDGSKKRKREM